MGVPIQLRRFHPRGEVNPVQLARLSGLGDDLDAAIAIAEVAITLAEINGAPGRAVATLKESVRKLKKRRKDTQK